MTDRSCLVLHPDATIRPGQLDRLEIVKPPPDAPQRFDYWSDADTNSGLPGFARTELHFKDERGVVKFAEFSRTEPARQDTELAKIVAELGALHR